MNPQCDMSCVYFSWEDGMLIATFKKGLEIDLPIARKVVDDRLKFTNHKETPVLIQSEGHVTMNKEARDFLASPKGTEGLIASAMVLRNAFDWAVGSFFLHLCKSDVPSRVFTHHDAAIRWLSDLVN